MKMDTMAIALIGVYNNSPLATVVVLFLICHKLSIFSSSQGIVVSAVRGASHLLNPMPRLSPTEVGTMNSGCKSMTCVVDARRPVRPTYVNLYKWPESDAEFVKSMTGGGGADHSLTSSNNVDGSRKWNQSPSPKVVNSYSCRQMYLRSYVFSKEETATGKARHYLGKAKERAIVLFPFLQIKAENRRVGSARRGEKKTAGKLIKEISYSALFSIFYRFLFCTGTSVEVVDHTR